MHTQNNNKHSAFAKQFLVMLLSVLFTANLWAQAGVSIFTYGDVKLRSVDGSLSELSKGMTFNTGDAIITGVNGRVQLRMDDGAIFDLKPNTEFIIDEYNYSNVADETPEVEKEEDKGFYRIMRGGFRAISGLIGKRNKKNYRITTPVATIGIRGTDFTVELCEVNCSPVYGKGLYLTVGSGGVVMANAGGSLDVDAGFGGFAADPSTAPVPTGATNNNDSGDDSVESDNNVTLNAPPPPPPPPAPTTPGRAAISIKGSVDQSTSSGANIDVRGRNDELINFTTPTTEYDLGTARVRNRGSDNTTGLNWGRWSEGTATATTARSTTDIDLTNSSAHYIYSSNDITPSIPLTGTANFRLIGNTNPTDNMGNRGTLGTATFSTDFTIQTVDADVNLSLNAETWDASVSGAALDGDAASFSGNFDTVTITDEASGSVADGAGRMEGFFSGDANGDIAGAAMAYSLTDNVDTEVEGTLAFEIVP